MALTPESFTAIAQRKAQSAQVHVQVAEEELKEANEQLEQAIPLGDTEEIRVAHEHTQEAERAVIKASEELEVVSELLHPTLDKERPEKRSGEGLRDLLGRKKQGPTQ